MKLYTYPGNPRAMKALIAAEYNGVAIDIPEFNVPHDSRTSEFLQKNPLGKVPVLETKDGCIFESNAIARYVARLRNDTGLYGKTFFESAQIDAWVDFSANELEVPLSMWLYPILGYAPFNAGITAKAKEDGKKALQILENHLHLRTFVVGEQVTLADIVLACALLYPMKMIFDKEYRKPFSAVCRWFGTLVNQPEFQVIMGDVPLCDVALVADGDQSEKKEEKKETKKAAKKDTAKEEKEDDVLDELKPQKKAEHPLAALNREKPSKMVMDAWKVQYSNTKDLSKAMEWFWANFDAEGYSLWFCDYNYNNENKKLFMTCNGVSGFLQRSEAMRKFAFGIMDVCGEEGKELIITGCWLFRGDSEKHMIEANPDAEYYTWKRVAKLDEEAKKRIAAYWCECNVLEGRPILDSKVFK